VVARRIAYRGVYNAVGATVGPGGLHVLGGYIVTNAIDPIVAVTTHQIYDAAANVWTMGPPLLAPRSGPIAVTGRDGTIYVIGGSDNNGNILASVEALDPATQTWKYVASMNTARDALAAVTGPDGKIYAIGGSTARYAYQHG
jgi:N-acetylneuraminic acid mutarotase